LSFSATFLALHYVEVSVYLPHHSAKNSPVQQYLKCYERKVAGVLAQQGLWPLSLIVQY
jgi:hypothetical protein